MCNIFIVYNTNTNTHNLLLIWYQDLFLTCTYSDQAEIHIKLSPQSKWNEFTNYPCDKGIQIQFPGILKREKQGLNKNFRTADENKGILIHHAASRQG